MSQDIEKYEAPLSSSQKDGGIEVRSAADNKKNVGMSETLWEKKQ